MRGTLTADESALEGFDFAGIVTRDTATGPVQALRFTADTNTLTGMRLAVTHDGITQLTRGAGADPAVLAGHVVMDVTLFKATLAGVPVEFTPADPPPAGMILPEMTFTDVEADIVLVTSDQMIIDGMAQSLSAAG